MKNIKLVKYAVAGLAVAAFIGISLPVMADTNAVANQTVTLQVDPIQQISAAGAPSLHITTAVAGQAPTGITNNSSGTYSITSNDGTVKIQAKIDTAMPSGTQLRLTAATTGGTVVPRVSLSDSDQDLVTGLHLVSEADKALTYEFLATAAAGKLSSFEKLVTLTIVQ